MKRTEKALTRSEVVILLRTVAARLPEEVCNVGIRNTLEMVASEIKEGNIGYIDDDRDPVIATIVQHLYAISDSPIRRQQIDWDLIQTVGNGSTMDILAEPISLYLDLAGCDPENTEAPTIHRRDVARVLALFTKTIRSYNNKNPNINLKDWADVIRLIDEAQEADKDKVPIKETGANKEFITKEDARDILMHIVSRMEGNQKKDDRN